MPLQNNSPNFDAKIFLLSQIPSTPLVVLQCSPIYFHKLLVSRSLSHPPIPPSHHRHPRSRTTSEWVFVVPLTSPRRSACPHRSVTSFFYSTRIKALLVVPIPSHALALQSTTWEPSPSKCSCLRILARMGLKRGTDLMKKWCSWKMCEWHSWFFFWKNLQGDVKWIRKRWIL